MEHMGKNKLRSFEIIAIEAVLYLLHTVFTTFPNKTTDIIFRDAMSPLKALDKFQKPKLRQIRQAANNLIETHNIKLVIQLIPGHVNTPSNDRAVTLAKMGFRQEQYSETIHQ